MREVQKIILVADSESLARTYDIACLQVGSNMPTVMAGALRLGVSQLGLTKIIRLKKEKAKITGKHIALAAIIPGGMAVLGTKALVTSLPDLDFDLDKALIKIRQSLGIATKISYTPLDEANNITLGMGQVPMNNSFYISHPINSDVYIPLNNYDKFLAKEKNNVFMELAAALGAKSIYLEDASFYNAKGNIETDFSVLKPIAMDIGINTNFEKDGSIKKEIHSSFDKSRRSPMVPTHLQKWVDIDSDLSLMVSHRLNNGLRSHQISLHFSDSLEGAVDAAAKITGTNKSFGLKASARKYIASTWVFKVEYHSMNDE